jgi:hypothetical protein
MGQQGWSVHRRYPHGDRRARFARITTGDQGVTQRFLVTRTPFGSVGYWGAPLATWLARTCCSGGGQQASRSW